MPTNLSTFLGSSFAGAQGAQGSIGPQGAQGTGPQGAQGAQGTSGATVIPAGTVLLFYQAAAPTGWTQVTTQNNKALRVVSGTGGVAGGTSAFTSVFTSRTPAGTVNMSNAAVTLAESQIPSHSHGVPRYLGSKNGDGSAGFNYSTSHLGPGTGSVGSDNTGGSGSHTHANTATFSGTALDFAVQYIDIILCSKN